MKLELAVPPPPMADGPAFAVHMSYTEHQTELRYQRTTDEIDVFLVEDHGLFRQGLSELLIANDPALHVVGDTDSAEEALQLIPELAPDVVLMDVHLSAMSGIEAIRRLAVTSPSVRVLVISGSADDTDIMKALLAGARGYILKASPVHDIVAGIRTAAAGGSVLSPTVASQLLAHVRRNAPALSLGAEPVGQLTPRETEVLRLMAEGLENSEIAARLVISTRTARNHVASILEKLQMQNRIQAAVYAVKHGLA
jgi:DNA-binding NarL/FixJ family response regulator